MVACKPARVLLLEPAARADCSFPNPHHTAAVRCGLTTLGVHDEPPGWLMPRDISGLLVWFGLVWFGFVLLFNVTRRIMSGHTALACGCR
jgi:hypothetical protein